MSEKDAPGTLIDEKQALDLYLEALLKEAPVVEEEPVATTIDSAAEAEVAEPPVAASRT